MFLLVVIDLHRLSIVFHSFVIVVHCFVDRLSHVFLTDSHTVFIVLSWRSS